MNILVKGEGKAWAEVPLDEASQSSLGLLEGAVGSAAGRGDTDLYWKTPGGAVVRLGEENLQDFLRPRLVAVPKGGSPPGSIAFRGPTGNVGKAESLPRTRTERGRALQIPMQHPGAPPLGGRSPPAVSPRAMPPIAATPPAGGVALVMPPHISPERGNRGRGRGAARARVRMRAGSKTTDDIPSLRPLPAPTSGGLRGRGMRGKLPGRSMTPTLSKRPLPTPQLANALTLPKLPPNPKPRKRVQRLTLELDKEAMEAQFDILDNASESRSRGMTTRIDYRNECLKEIYETERDYLADLDILMRVFKTPLELLQMVTAAEVEEIFSNAESLQRCNQEFYEKLASITENDYSLGSCFTSMAGDFLDNYKIYCANQEVATSTYERLCKRNAQFARYLEVCHSDPQCNGLRIVDYLIKPVQRICKYPLLLRELLKHTSQDHSDFQSISEASRLIEEVVNSLNEWQRKEQMLRTVRDLEERFGPTCPRLADNQLIREGVLTLHRSATSKGHNTYVYLFSQYFLVTARGGNELKFAIPLSSCKLVVFADSEGLMNAFEVKNSLGKASGIFSTHSNVSKQGWIKDIKAEIKEYQKKAVQHMKNRK